MDSVVVIKPLHYSLTVFCNQTYTVGLNAPGLADVAFIALEIDIDAGKPQLRRFSNSPIMPGMPDGCVMSSAGNTPFSIGKGQLTT